MEYNQTPNKIKTIILLLVVVFGIIGFAVLIINRSANVKKIKEDGVYVLGKNTSSMTWKNGRAFDFMYVYKGVVYETSVIAPAYAYSEGDLIFVRISPSDPSKNTRGNYPRPGPCITFDAQPAEGWKEIPTCK